MGRYGGQFVFSHVCLDVAAVRPVEGLDGAQSGPTDPGDPVGRGVVWVRY